jgi:hypothetical protein
VKSSENPPAIFGALSARDSGALGMPSVINIRNPNFLHPQSANPQSTNLPSVSPENLRTWNSKFAIRKIAIPDM